MPGYELRLIEAALAQALTVQGNGDNGLWSKCIYVCLQALKEQSGQGPSQMETTIIFKPVNGVFQPLSVDSNGFEP